MRTMPVLAKQVATLDQLSGGRVILGVGTGAYREEYEALFPDATGRPPRRRSSTRACGRCACSSPSARRASAGAHVRFEEVECFPKPRQTPLPMYAGATTPRCGGAPGSTARAGCRRCSRPRRSSAGVEDVHRAAAAAGRDGSRDRHRAAVRVLDRAHPRRGGEALPRLPALQAPGVAQAVDAARAAGRRLRAAQPDRQPGRDLRARSASTSGRASPRCSGMLFVANTVPEMQEAIELFGREVIPNFRK